MRFFAAAASAALVGATLVRYGLGLDGLAWSLCVLFLVALAWADLRTRRIPNRALASAAILASGLRAVFAPGLLGKTVLVGLLAFSVFYLLSLLFKDGLGMGDLKLIGLLGLLLGPAVVVALVAGCVAGALAAAVLMIRRHAGLRSSFAYGPYLAFGGVVAILVGSPTRFF